MNLCGIYVRFPPVIVIPKLLLIMFRLPTLYNSHTQLTASLNIRHIHTTQKGTCCIFTTMITFYLIYIIIRFIN